MRRLYCAVLLAVVLVACGGGGSETPAPAAPSTSIVARGSGTGDEVSDDFRIPRNCDRQQLSYKGTQIDPDIDVAWVNFRVYDADGDPAESAIGPADFLDAESGAGLWTLDAGGPYTIEVTSGNADWSYTLRCR